MPAPGFVKMDIEEVGGAALEGARGILAEAPPNWVIEVHGEEEEAHCLKVLSEFAYAIRMVSGTPILREYRPGAVNHWLLAKPR